MDMFYPLCTLRVHNYIFNYFTVFLSKLSYVFDTLCSTIYSTTQYHTLHTNKHKLDIAKAQVGFIIFFLKNDLADESKE